MHYLDHICWHERFSAGEPTPPARQENLDGSFEEARELMHVAQSAATARLLWATLEAQYQDRPAIFNELIEQLRSKGVLSANELFYLGTLTQLPFLESMLGYCDYLALRLLEKKKQGEQDAEVVAELFGIPATRPSPELYGDPVVQYMLSLKEYSAKAFMERLVEKFPEQAADFTERWSVQGQLQSCGLEPNSESKSKYNSRDSHPLSESSSVEDLEQLITAWCCAIKRYPGHLSPQRSMEYVLTQFSASWRQHYCHLSQELISKCAEELSTAFRRLVDKEDVEEKLQELAVRDLESKM